MTAKPNRKARRTAPEPAPSTRGWKSRLTLHRGWMAAGGTAIAIAGSAMFNHARARQAEARSPAIGAFIEVDGVRLHYVDRGEGPVVVLLHGNGAMLQDFEASGVFGLAAEGHRVLAFDRPGFGYSDRPRATIWSPGAQAELIAHALRQIGVDRAIIVGHSWGTMVAVAMALDHPEIVAGLVLISGYYYATARPDVLTGALPGVPVLGDIMANTMSPLLGALAAPSGVKAAFAPAEIPERFAAFPAQMALRPSQLRATGADTALMVPSARTLSARYAQLDLPVIVFAGEGDLVVGPKRHAERFVQEVERSELRHVPGQGHMLHYAVPEQIVTAIDDVIAQASMT